jgi:hypothetical protein
MSLCQGYNFFNAYPGRCPGLTYLSLSDCIRNACGGEFNPKLEASATLHPQAFGLKVVREKNCKNDNLQNIQICSTPFGVGEMGQSDTVGFTYGYSDLIPCGISRKGRKAKSQE